MCRSLALTFVLSLVCALLVKDHGYVRAQSPPAVPLAAQNFFGDIETSVEQLAANALINYQNRESLWQTCNTNMRCSVFACQPPQLYANNSQCMALPGNIVCGGAIGSVAGCKNATVSTSSYVRLPPKAKEFDLTCDTQMAICSQKDLDWQAFEKIYPMDGGPFNKIAWSFFGSSNGVFRIYPGLELPPRNCSPWSYDPRKRPWYKAVLGVSKEVVVLLDTGGSMANPLSLAAGNTVQVFSAAQQIVTEFLDTLNTDDIVSVYSFDGTRTSLVNKKFGANLFTRKCAVLNLEESVNSHDLMYQLPLASKIRSPSGAGSLVGTAKVQISIDDKKSKAALDPLKTAIDSITVTSNSAEANLTAALETVLFQGGFDQSIEVENMKIILIITGGELSDGPSITIPFSVGEAVTTGQVRTFIYELSDSSAPDSQASQLADLKSVACSLGGSFDQIPRDNILDDPISALLSFYSYVASLRFELDGKKPLWVPSYAAYTGVGKVMTVVYPVLDGIFLVGVAAIDLLTDEIEAEWPNAIDNWRKPADNKHSRGSPVNCSVSLIPDPPVCPDDGISDRGLCLGNSLTFVNTQEDYLNRTCCDVGCGLPKGAGANSIKTSESFFDKTGNKVAVIGSAACFFLLLLLGLYLLRVNIWGGDHAPPVVVTGVITPTSNGVNGHGSPVNHPSPVVTSPNIQSSSASRALQVQTPVSVNPHTPGQVEGEENKPHGPKWYDVAL